MTTGFTPDLFSTCGERLAKTEERIRFLQAALDRVARERDIAVAELLHLERVGNVLSSKRRHP